MEVTLWPVYDNNKVVGAEGILRDVTEKKIMLEELRKSEAKYKETAEMLQKMIDVAPTAILAWDLNFKINLWNKEAERLFGWRAEEVMGKDFVELHVPEKERERVREVVREVMRSGQPSININENLTKDGRRLIVEWYNFAVRDVEGKIVGAASIGVNLTEKVNMVRKIRENEEKFRKIFENSPNIVAIVNKDGIFVEANPSAIKSLGLSPIGKSFLEVLPSDKEVE
ncbi:hypothetical protein DRP05_14980 [Archaeoglobales archaeon]|nr:MAG: hypothetical protein DRP05_14980 [Archaeoglobales archaeon]